MYFRIYKDAQGYWRWTFYAVNNRKLADSGESYHNKQDCLWAINLLKGSSQAPVNEG
jgi:uncharacterized protein